MDRDSPQRVLGLLRIWRYLSRIASPLPTFVLCALGLGALGCSQAPIGTTLDFGARGERYVPRLAACRNDPPLRQTIDPDEPLVVLVHGCSSSGGRFRSLAQVFELHGQQTLCFNYDDRNSIRGSGRQLRAALQALRAHMHNDRVTVLGHSQGGLVARAALSGTAPPNDDKAAPPRYRLVTVSSPFAGIEAASHCGLVALHVLTLGITVGICQLVAGSKWTDIRPDSALVREPAPLWPAVESHLAIVTDERNSCRREAPDGSCDESDFVFDVAEQYNADLLSDRRVQHDRIAAGHVEIVGESGAHPDKLIEALQQYGVLAPTPPQKREALAALLRRLF